MVKQRIPNPLIRVRFLYLLSRRSFPYKGSLAGSRRPGKVGAQSMSQMGRLGCYIPRLTGFDSLMDY